MVLAEVILPLPLDQTYTYLVPDALEEHARVGCRVLVPFGNRRLTGVITEMRQADHEAENLKPIEDVLDEVPSLSSELLRLTKWIAEYYVCGWGEVVKAALPTGTDVESEYVVRFASLPLDGAPTDKLARRVLHYLSTHEEAALSGLRKAVKGITLAQLRRLEQQGLVTIELEMSRARVRIKYEKAVRLAPAYRTLDKEQLKAQAKGVKQVAVLEALADAAARGETTLSQPDVLARANASAATLRGLVSRGIIEILEREVVRAPFGSSARAPHHAPSHELHEGQKYALDKIHKALDKGRFQTFLLHGVTGSGKTEVYIAALKHVLAQGKTGIILVPEIALTPQTVRRFQAHFGDRIAVLHSRMSLGERYDTWRMLRSGRFSVVIGPRSAIFAPLANVGLIVVDEEHESSYKQFDPAPRYHARDVAVVRAQMNEAVCVLGSATPSLESYVNAHTGKYELLRMPERVPVAGKKAAPLPPVKVIDLGLERKKHQLEGALSAELREAIRLRLARKEQVILLQNRRGYAPIIECYSCGWTPYCYDCSVTLTYHKAKRHLRCHYCGRTQRLPSACPKCGEPELELLGTGTQRVEEELAVLFPDATIIRMDLDTTGRKDAHHRLLSKFGRGEADILIGTQMVAKGLDFPRVTLVGVINADAGMLLPDFRAEERTFQLLTQVAGRAGRADLRGEVILQTRNPGHVVLRYAREHDYMGFVDAVLPDRKTFGYPPFGRVVGVEFRGPEQGTVRDLARGWTDELRKHAAGLQVLGPEAAFVGRIKRQYRYHTIIKAPRNGAADLQNLIRHTNLIYGSPPKGYRIAIDVDAMGLF